MRNCREVTNTDFENIHDLGLSACAYDSLKKAGVVTLQQTQKLKDEEILKLKYVNRKVFAEIKVCQLKEMHLNHALRHFNESEFVYYFEYGKKYTEALSDYFEHEKCVMTDGENIYLCHFNSDNKIVDVEFIAKLKY